MKIFAFILAMFTFVMTVIPCCWDDIIEHDDEAACHQKHMPYNHHSSCPEGHCCCSPFSSCAGCSLLIIADNVVYTFVCKPLLRMHVEKPYINQYVFDLFACIWQPPRQL